MQGICEGCGNAEVEAVLAPDPFNLEIHGDYTEVWLCESCRYERARDV
jgi:hypothetical protein